MSSWRSAVANGIVITFVSLLLWLWAAGQTRETATVQLLVRFTTAEPESSLVQPMEALPVEVELQGSRRDLERATDRLSGTTLTLRTGRDGVPATPGSYLVDLATAIGRSEEIEQAGVGAVGTSPTSVSITVLETVTLEATIVPAIPGVQLTGEPLLEPAKAEVNLPKSLAAALGPDPRIEAFVAPTQLSALGSGGRHRVDATLRVPEALEPQAKLVRIRPEKARVTFTIRSRSSVATLRLVPVQIAGPPADLDGYRVTLEPDDAFLRDVEVTGPSETIRALEEGRERIFAFVHLSADDLARRVTRKRIDLWMLPAGVTVNRIGESQDTSPIVRMTIGDRAARP